MCKTMQKKNKNGTGQCWWMFHMRSIKTCLCLLFFVSYIVFITFIVRQCAPTAEEYLKVIGD